MVRKAYISIILTAIIVLILLAHINYLRFVCDDAFISFRYAKNFVEGNGLVYNIGEKVEGYSNFLWTLLLSLFMKIGLDPVMMSQILGVLFGLMMIYFSFMHKKRKEFIRWLDNQIMKGSKGFTLSDIIFDDLWSWALGKVDLVQERGDIFRMII